MVFGFVVFALFTFVVIRLLLDEHWFGLYNWLFVLSGCAKLVFCLCTVGFDLPVFGADSGCFMVLTGCLGFAELCLFGCSLVCLFGITLLLIESCFILL